MREISVLLNFYNGNITMSSNILNSSILQLQTLETEFSNVMIQYELAYMNYINSLGSGKDSSKKFVTLPKRAFYGSGSVNNINVQTSEQCVSACSADTTCTGATFNSQTQSCMLRKGAGPVIPADDNTSAIVLELAQNANILQLLNQKLISLHEQMSTLLSSLSPEIQQQIQEKNMNKQNLETQYQMLMDERNKIRSLVQEYEDLSQSYNDTYTQTQQENSQYIFYVIVTILLVIYTIKTMVFPNVVSFPLKGLFWLLVFISVTISLLMRQNPGNFFLMCLLFLFIVLAKLKVIPTP
jgi:hypothetical protein